MILRKSLLQSFSFCLFLSITQSATPEAQPNAFGGGLSITGLVLLAVSIAVYVLEKPKVKYVEFESFEVENKKKNSAFNTEIKLSLHNDEPESHKSIPPPSQSPQDTNNPSTSIERKRRKRKLDRLQALSKKESASDIKGEVEKQYRDSCIEVE